MNGTQTRRIHFLVICCFACLIAVFSANAQPGVWETYGPELEISVEVISVDTLQAGTIYLGTTTNGVFFTTNGGVNWRQANLPLSSGRVSALLPEAGTVYAALGSSATQSNSAPRGVFRSSDGGINWLPANPPLQDNNVLALRRFGSRLYAGTAQLGLFYSTNGGIDWNSVSEPLNFGPVALLKEFSGTLFAGTINQGLYFSADSGASWTRAVFDSAVTQNLTVSTMTRVGDVIFAGINRCNECSGVFASSDGGANFIPVAPAPNGPFIHSLISSGNSIFAGSKTGVFSSTDGGINWIQSPEPLKSTEVLSLYKNSRVVLAGTRGAGLFRSFDEGLTWEELLSNDLSGQTVQTISAAGDGIYAGTTQAGLFSSDSSGDNWFPREVKANQTIAGLVLKENYTLAYGDGIYRSIDGGFSWVSAQAPIDAQKILTVRLHDNLLIAGTGVAADSMVGSGLWYSPDGLNWTQSLIPATTSTVTALLPAGNQVFAAANTGLFTSSDGMNWAATSAPPLTYLSLSASGGIIFTGTKGYGIARSIDQGGNWEFAGGEIANKNVEKLFAVSGVFYAATRSNGLYRSADGQTWLSSGIPMANKSVNDMIAFNGQVYAATGSTDPLIGIPNTGLFVSSDNGLTWLLVELPDNNINVTSLLQINDFLYTGGTRQFVSANGIRWTPLGLGLRTDQVNRIDSYIFPGETRLYAASNNGVFFQTIDQSPPLAQGIAPAGGSGFSGDRDLSLLLMASGADSVIIAEDSTFAGANWQGFSELLNYRLSEGDGEKTIFARFKDLSWNLSGIVQTSVILDSKPPEFAAHTPPGNAAIGRGVTINQQVFDANPDRSELYFRRIGEPFSENRKSLFAGDSAEVDEVFITNRGIDYRITATDRAGLSDTLRNGALDFYSLPVNLAAGQLGSSPGLPGGTGGSAFRIISLPMQLNGTPSATSVLGDLGKYGTDGDWLFWNYNDNNQWSQGANTALQTGSGYFILLRNGRTLTNQVAGTTAKTTEGVLGEIPGWQLRGNDWTLIGNPYLTRIDLGQLKLKNRNKRLIEPDTSFQVWAYDGRSENNGWLNENLTLEPWGGLAIFVTAPDTLVFANASDPFAPPGLGKPAAFPLLSRVNFSEGEWQVQVKAEIEDFSDQLNYLGVRKNARAGLDKYDSYEPPLLPGGVSVSFTHPEWGIAADYSADIRQAGQAGYEWPLMVTAPPGVSVTLQFDNLETIPVHFEAVLVDEETGILRDLREQPQVEARIPEHSSSKMLKVLVGDPFFVQSQSNGLSAIPEQFVLKQNYPNPFNPSTVIRYGLPVRGQVSLKIYDVLGREVLTLSDKQPREAGYYETVADLRRYGSGVYFYRLTVEGEQRFKDVKKMLLVK